MTDEKKLKSYNGLAFKRLCQLQLLKW